MTDPATPPAAPAAPAAAGPKQALSLTGFILGIAGFVLAWIIGLGFLPSLAAIIISVLARKREPEAPQWMKLIGLIGGIVGIVISVIFGLVWIIGAIALATTCAGLSAYGC